MTTDRTAWEIENLPAMPCRCGRGRVIPEATLALGELACATCASDAQRDDAIREALAFIALAHHDGADATIYRNLADLLAPSTQKG